jgi:hypothetical protein
MLYYPLDLWIRAVLVTLLIEVPVYWLVARSYTKGWRAVIAGAGGTLISHPFLCFLWIRLFSDFWAFAISGEALVFFFEALFFWLVAKPIPLKRAFWASFLANASSALLGSALLTLFR